MAEIKNGDGDRELATHCSICGRAISPEAHDPLCRWCEGTAKEAGRQLADAERYEREGERMSEKWIVSGTQRTVLQATGPTLADAVRLFRVSYPSVNPDGWEKEVGGTYADDGEIIGICEGCECPILDGDGYRVDSEGVYECVRCAP